MSDDYLQSVRDGLNDEDTRNAVQASVAALPSAVRQRLSTQSAQDIWERHRAAEARVRQIFQEGVVDLFWSPPPIVVEDLLDGLVSALGDAGPSEANFHEMFVDHVMSLLGSEPHQGQVTIARVVNDDTDVDNCDAELDIESILDQPTEVLVQVENGYLIATFSNWFSNRALQTFKEDLEQVVRTVARSYAVDDSFLSLAKSPPRFPVLLSNELNRCGEGMERTSCLYFGKEEGFLHRRLSRCMRLLIQSDHSSDHMVALTLIEAASKALLGARGTKPQQVVTMHASVLLEPDANLRKAADHFASDWWSAFTCCLWEDHEEDLFRLRLQARMFIGAAIDAIVRWKQSWVLATRDEEAFVKELHLARTSKRPILGGRESSFAHLWRNGVIGE